VISFAQAGKPFKQRSTGMIESDPVKPLGGFDSRCRTAYNRRIRPSSTPFEVFGFMLQRYAVIPSVLGLLIFLLVMPPLVRAQETPSALEEGKAALKAGKINQAVEIFSQIIAITPQAPMYYYRGISYRSNNNHAAAIQDFDKAISLKPNEPSYYLQRGMSLHRIQEHQRAINDFSRVLELDPMNPYALANRARARFAMNSIDKALDDVTEAIQQVQDNSSLYKLRGDIFCANGAYDRAVADYDKAIELTPNYPAVYNNRGTALANLGKTKEALKDFVTAMEAAESLPSFGQLPGFAPDTW